MNKFSSKLFQSKLVSTIKNDFNKKKVSFLRLAEELKEQKSNLKLKLKSDQFNPAIWIELLQDKLEKVTTSDKNRIVIKQSKFWVRSITWVLISSTGFAIAWINIAKTDEVVIAIGKLEPKKGVVEVQMPLAGIAEEILVTEGEQVKKGQILIKLDNETTKAQNKALEKNLEINKQIIEKYAFLVKEGAVSELQYLQQQTRIEEIKSQIKTNLVKLKYQEIISPVNGVVFDLQAKSAGFVANTSQPVLKIVPGGDLVAKVEINSRSIGFVQTGKVAEISIDSFPATDFGVINGKLTKLSSDALAPSPAEGKGYRFPAVITLDTQYLELKSGKKLQLQPGMSLSANIKLRKVSYLQLLLNKFGDKANSLKAI